VNERSCLETEMGQKDGSEEASKQSQVEVFIGGVNLAADDSISKFVKNGT